MSGTTTKSNIKYDATYSSWSHMWNRCRNPNHSSFKWYGEKGVGVCERWKSFANFLSDMGPRPLEHSIDRLDASKDYGPDNCRWANHRQQARGRSNVKLNEAIVAEARARHANGESHHALAAAYGVKRDTMLKIVQGILWK